MQQKLLMLRLTRGYAVLKLKAKKEKILLMLRLIVTPHC